MNETAKRALRIAEKVLVILVVAIAVFMMVFTIISVTAFDKTERDIFGLQMYIVKSNSMKKTHFEVGDLVVAKEFDPGSKKDVAQLKVGTIITFQSMSSDSRGETVTHQIVGFETYGLSEKGEAVPYGGKALTDEEVKSFIKSGKPFVCVTKGTSNKLLDEARVETGYIFSTYLFDIPNAGDFFNFLKSTEGYITCILIPFLLLIGYEGYVCVRLFLRYRSEQLAGIREREAQLDAEREETRRQMAELAELRAMLNRQMAGDGEGASEKPSDKSDD